MHRGTSVAVRPERAPRRPATRRGRPGGVLAACLLLTGLLLAAVHQAGRAAAAPSPYLLPYPAGLAVQVTQGNAAGDHSAENQSEYAFDFGAGGTQFPVLAARAGIVHGEQHTSPGPCRPFGCWQQGNYVLIDHGDGTSALYLHLAENQVYVHTGDHVVQGQRIGLADDTGFSAGSHLHLQVGETPCPRPDPQTRTPCEDRPGWWWPPSTPTWFADRDVVARAPGGVPQADVSYASDNVEPGQSPGGGPSTAPPDDWDDHSYTVTCDGLVPQGFRATLRNGNATVFGSDVGSSDYTTFQVTDEATARGDVTGDGAPETVVLLSCTPQPSN